MRRIGKALAGLEPVDVDVPDDPPPEPFSLGPEPWRLQPWTVYGGFRIALARWAMGKAGWEHEHQLVDPIVYKTEAECAAEIERWRDRAKRSMTGGAARP